MTSISGIRSAVALVALLALLYPVAAGRPALAQSDADPKQPQKHFTVARPAELTGDDAEAIYGRIQQDLVAGYRLSGEAYAAPYQRWPRYNTEPYRSAQHGERFANNYGNDKAGAYRLYERSGPMPRGAILVKDSFAVTEKGDVFSGPLFVMEKMAPGFNPESGDWRYTMIMPDGSLLGVTGGSGSDRMEFCVSCHAGVQEDQDHMFYVPPPFRLGGVQ